MRHIIIYIFISTNTIIREHNHFWRKSNNRPWPVDTIAPQPPFLLKDAFIRSNTPLRQSIMQELALESLLRMESSWRRSEGWLAACWLLARWASLQFLHKGTHHHRGYSKAVGSTMIVLFGWFLSIALASIYSFLFPSKLTPLRFCHAHPLIHAHKHRLQKRRTDSAITRHAMWQDWQPMPTFWLIRLAFVPGAITTNIKNLFQWNNWSNTYAITNSPTPNMEAFVPLGFPFCLLATTRNMDFNCTNPTHRATIQVGRPQSLGPTIRQARHCWRMNILSPPCQMWRAHFSWQSRVWTRLRS